MLMCKEMPSVKVVRDTFIACHQNKYQISAINHIKSQKRLSRLSIKNNLYYYFFYTDFTTLKKKTR